MCLHEQMQSFMSRHWSIQCFSSFSHYAEQWYHTPLSHAKSCALLQVSQLVEPAAFERGSLPGGERFAGDCIQRSQITRPVEYANVHGDKAMTHPQTQACIHILCLSLIHTGTFIHRDSYPSLRHTHFKWNTCALVSLFRRIYNACAHTQTRWWISGTFHLSFPHQLLPQLAVPSFLLQIRAGLHTAILLPHCDTVSRSPLHLDDDQIHVPSLAPKLSFPLASSRHRRLKPTVVILMGTVEKSYRRPGELAT